MKMQNYNISTCERANKELKKMPSNLNLLFLKHFAKIPRNFEPTKHLKYGIPYFVEKVTTSARFYYEIDGTTIKVLRCFKNHKEYEDWYKSLK